MKFIRKNIKIITFIIIVIIVICLILLKIYLNSKTKEEVIENKDKDSKINILEETVLEEEKEIAFIDIKGEVINPGVYEIESSKKVIDQTCSIMIQRLRTIFQRNPLISMGI